MTRHHFLAVLLCGMCVVSLAGGEAPAVQKSGGKVPGPETSARTNLVKYYENRTELVRTTSEQTWVKANNAYRKLDRVTVVAGPIKDRFGDPMYTAYGPLPYANSPMYSGPAYAASFEREYADFVPDARFRGYSRQRYSHPTLHARTDMSLGVGASHSYMQHGMMWHPGSQAPSAARAITNNRW